LRCGVVAAKNVVAMVANDAARVRHEAVAYLGMFDVTMGRFHGPEVCELAGILILNDLANTYGTNNIGLYMDDGLAIFKNTTGPLAERL